MLDNVNAFIEIFSLAGNPAGPLCDRTFGAKDLFVDWDLASPAAEWLSGENHGVILEAPASDPKSEVKFASNDDGDADERPRLEVCYWP